MLRVCLFGFCLWVISCLLVCDRLDSLFAFDCCVGCVLVDLLFCVLFMVRFGDYVV